MTDKELTNSAPEDFWAYWSKTSPAGCRTKPAYICPDIAKKAGSSQRRVNGKNVQFDAVIVLR